MQITPETYCITAETLLEMNLIFSAIPPRQLHELTGLPLDRCIMLSVFFCDQARRAGAVTPLPPGFSAEDGGWGARQEVRPPARGECLPG